MPPEIVSSDSWYQLISIIIAVAAFFLSLWNLLSPYFLKVKLILLPENQIQLISEVRWDKIVIAFNVLFVILTKGSNTEWDTYKFLKADLSVPDGRKISFRGWGYLLEKDWWQKNDSRNIPIPIQGWQGKTTTASFLSHDFWDWQVGKYEIAFTVTNSKSKIIPCKRMKFSLDQKYLEIIRRPNATLMLESELMS